MRFYELACLLPLAVLVPACQSTSSSAAKPDASAKAKSGSAAAADAALAERVEKLEAEVAKLKKMLKRLKADVTGDADEAA